MDGQRKIPLSVPVNRKNLILTPYLEYCLFNTSIIAEPAKKNQCKDNYLRFIVILMFYQKIVNTTKSPIHPCFIINEGPH